MRPRLDAIALHQVGHRLHRAGIPILPRVLDGLIFLLFNSVIHHTTQVGEGTVCGYRGMSVLIHRKAIVGRNVMLGPHVVIGGRSDQEPPLIEDDAYIGANACVLGAVRVGAGSVIGAGAVVLADVPAGAVVAGNPARSLERHGTAAAR